METQHKSRNTDLLSLKRSIIISDAMLLFFLGLNLNVLFVKLLVKASFVKSLFLSTPCIVKLHACMEKVNLSFDLLELSFH